MIPGNTATGAFNPYNTANASLDRSDADRIRRQNLQAYLQAFSRPPRVLLVGEAPGWRGARFSGVPFTSEAQLINGSLPLRGAQSSSAPHPYTETSASTTWDKLIACDLYPAAFIWNAFPLHPHKPGIPTTNRKPTQHECRQFRPLLEELIHLLKPRTIVAVGRSAEDVLSDSKIESVYVRHPSHGGGPAFRSGIDQVVRMVA